MKNGDTPTFESLLTMLSDKRPLERREAIFALTESRETRAVPRLIEMLQDKNHYVLIAAANALGEIGDEAAILPLLELLKYDESIGLTLRLNTRNRRLVAAKALSKFTGPAIDEILRGLCRDKSRLLRNIAKAEVAKRGITETGYHRLK